MKKTLLVSIVIIMLILIGCNQALSINIINRENTFHNLETDIIFVDEKNKDGPWIGNMTCPYQTISEAIENAKNGDIIYVLKGRYNEQIIVDKSLWIVGEDKKETIIDAQYNDYAIKITTDNVKIDKFTIKNSGGYKENAGIIVNKDNSKISDCIIKRNRIGIFLDHINKNNIENCTLYLNGKGINTKSSKNIKIKNNEVCFSSIGICSENSSDIELKKCQIHECGSALFFNKSSNVNFLECALYDNNDNGGGCVLYKSKDFNFENCNFLHSGFGMKIKESSNINIKNCDIKNITHYGIRIQKNCENMIIDSCNFINNFRRAIDIGSGNLQIIDSNLFNNQMESVNIANALCNARYNWWGSKLGPIFTYGFRIPSALKLRFGRLKYFPWSLNPYTNAGSDWKVKDKFSKTIVNGYEDDPIEFSGNDTDDDGLPDWWEERYDDYNPTVWEDHINIDNDGDGLNNFEECYAYEWGADPNKKDIFLEFDWVNTSTPGVTNKPSEEYIKKMKQCFEEHDINLHIDVGEQNFTGGEEIPYINGFELDKLTDLYWDYFLHNDLTTPRKNIFHYGLICERGPGAGFSFVGWGHLNGFCVAAGSLASGSKLISRERYIATGSMHELGHTLGLFVDDYDGIDNHGSKPRYKEFWLYRNYKSCMNYRYTWFILDYSDGTNGRRDFDDWGNLEYDFFKNTHFEWPKS